jgi:hypothetical protein
MTASACSTWRTQERFDGWTLHAEKDRPVDPTAYRVAFEPAFAVVETALDPFRRPVDVYAWNGSEDAIAHGAEIDEGEAGLVEEVEGIGPARVRAFHARGGDWFGPPSGIYIEAPETGTAVHELVHARLAEGKVDVPLWLEEGLACLLGDGFLADGRWIVDGLACWPLRELAEQELDADDLVQLLKLRAEDTTSVRDNVLVHFVGWAIVFDLYREDGAVRWKEWSQRYERSIGLDEARERIERTLAAETTRDWLARLSAPEPEVRLATAKGVWKLRSPVAIDSLLDALRDEKDPEVRVGFAINALAAAGEIRLPGPMSARLWRSVWPTLKRGKLEDPVEQAAIEELFRSFRYGGGRRSQPALAKLKRFWAE